ncbi:hypothetical protein T01_2748 [Trichinella spiralis]|uniref:Uncharacterized protein n=1 Tax=Trichinella spiralis TaxID=6334 RepID=A0A0V1BVK9_TRISP|nr:hypothetical protein T01_2748 [Trichinella spiralis]
MLIRPSVRPPVRTSWSLKTGLEPLARVYSPHGKNTYRRFNSSALSVAKCCFIIPVYTRILPTGEVQKRQPILRFQQSTFQLLITTDQCIGVVY